MHWIILGLLAALSQTGRAIFSKNILKNTNEYVVAYTTRLLNVLITLPILFFIDIPKINMAFWLSLIGAGILLSITSILYMKAIKTTDISLIMPLISFTPLVIVLISPFTIGEIPSLFGLFGIVLIIIGSYILNIKDRSRGYLEPFKKLFAHKGTILMLIVTPAWAFNTIMDKIGITNSSILFWMVSVNIIILIFLTPITLLKLGKKIKQVPKKLIKILPISLSNIGELVFYMFAIQITLVSYVISIKRVSILFGVMLGYLIFKEKNIKARLAGAVVMVLGVLFITLFN